jgi:ABC-2 type transport system permease protein
MRALLERAGVDYVQWKAISRTLLRADFRPPLQHDRTTYSLRSVRNWALMTIVYGTFGFSAAAVTFINRDVLLTGVVTLVYLSTLVVTALLTQHVPTIVASTDHSILGPLPISSRTFFAVRLTNIVFHATLLTALMGWPIVIVQTFARGVHPARGFAAAVSLLACSLATTFTVVAVYGIVLRTVGPARLQRILGYTQIFIGVIAYGGVFLLLGFTDQSQLADAALPRGVWLYFLPPAWYASYLEIASGTTDASVWGRAAISVVFLGAMAVLLRGPLAAGYAEHLSRISSDTPANAGGRARRAAWFFRSDEPRAVMLLVRAHFRHDVRVRLGILSTIPLTLLYMFIGARDGSGADPFRVEQDGEAFNLVAVAVLFFPTILIQHLSMSDAFRAAWIYFVTPASRTRLMVAMKNVIVWLFLTPFAVFLAAILTWRYQHAVHGIVHAAFLGLLSHIMLQGAMLVDPRLPFASAPQKSVASMTLFAWMVMSMMGGTFALFILQKFAYVSWTRVIVAAAILLVVAGLLNIALRQRAEALAESPDWV